MRIMPNCRETTHLVSRSLDEKLPLIDRIGMRIHLILCSVCLHYEKQLNWLERTLSRIQKTPRSEKMDSDFANQIKEKIRSQCDHKK